MPMSRRTTVASVELFDFGPLTNTFKEEVLAGLGQHPKSVPCKFFYDAEGSQLFDRICGLEEYYPTRTELAIMEADVDEMVERLGPGCLLVEYGSGSSLKTRLLLDRMEEPAGYVPIDISRDHLAESVSRLSERYPNVEILPVCADYTGRFDLPAPVRAPARVSIYFPGSTIGNFHPHEAVDFLKKMKAVCGSGGALLIGVDLQKDVDVLEAAYNDSDGVTADFNKNLLRRMNRELGSTFDLEAFRHEAVYNADEGRIEMYLVSLFEQRVQVDGQCIDFHAGERMSTEYSYKYTLDGFSALAAAGGFRVRESWTDADRMFSVQYLETEGDGTS